MSKLTLRLAVAGEYLARKGLWGTEVDGVAVLAAQHVGRRRAVYGV